MTHADKVFILHCEVCRGDLHKACLNKFGLACDKFCKLSFWMNCLCFFHKTEALSLNAFDSGCQFEPILHNVIGPIDARHSGHHATICEFLALPGVFQCDWQLMSAANNSVDLLVRWLHTAAALSYTLGRRSHGP